jgi:hypothetical protein
MDMKAILAGHRLKQGTFKPVKEAGASPVTLAARPSWKAREEAEAASRLAAGERAQLAKRGERAARIRTRRRRDSPLDYSLVYESDANGVTIGISTDFVVAIVVLMAATVVLTRV